MDIFERKATSEWDALRGKILEGMRDGHAFTALEEGLVEVYQLGRTDAGEVFEFTPKAQEQSLLIADTLVAFRERLIKGSIPSGIADMITANHHAAMWNKDFMKLAKGMEDESTG